MTVARYTAQLQAGLGMIDETRILLDLWHAGMDGPTLRQVALESGRFPQITARRLRNLITECFAPRYLVQEATPARVLTSLMDVLPPRAFVQLLFLYTCRANAILADFVREVYWPAYASGHTVLSNEEARTFVARANQEGKTTRPWSDKTIQNIAGRLTGCCADFGLLEPGVRRVRTILPYRIAPPVVLLLAYDLHFADYGDNRVIHDSDWALFGLEPDAVLDELKRLALRGFVLVQAAGGLTRIGWQYTTWEEVTNAITQREL